MNQGAEFIAIQVEIHKEKLLRPSVTVYAKDNLNKETISSIFP